MGDPPVPGWGQLGDYGRMSSIAPFSAVYVVAPDVPPGLTLNEYRRRRPRRRRRGLGLLSGVGRRPPATA